MHTHAEKSQAKRSQSTANEISQKQRGGESAFQFVDNRPEAVTQRKLQEMVNNSPEMIQLRDIQEMANNHVEPQQQSLVQKKDNNTGLPDNLKAGIENLSGYFMDNVKVHYNSAKPGPLQAHAFAQGTDIHLAPGQEKHLPHEAWHVVQQKQGRVKPTVQLMGRVDVNDDDALENEADVMGEKAMQMKKNHPKTTLQFVSGNPSFSIVQRIVDRDLAVGTRVRVVGSRKNGKEGVVEREEKGGYVLKLDGLKTPSHFQYRELVKIEVDPSGIEEASEVEQAEITTSVVSFEPGLDGREQTSGMSEGVSEHESEVHRELEYSESSIDLSSLEGQMRALFLRDDWNNHELVERIGTKPWSEIKGAWDSIDADLKRKFILVKLRGCPYAEDDTLDSYEGWEDNSMGEQTGYKWGTETEGGHISVSLKPEYQGEDKKEELKAALIYLKRTPLMDTEHYSLALDNVMDKMSQLIRGVAVPLPLEIASKPIAGELGIEEIRDRGKILGKESRADKVWPALRNNSGALQVKNGEPVAIARFNELFIVTGVVQNILRTQKPQHVTVSGAEEDRLAMAGELKGTAASFTGGTSGKIALSGKPKTSLEFLRHSSLSRTQVKELERHGHDIRESLRWMFKDVQYADEKLNGIIVPTTGAPREIGGYTLSTPMTNAFPLLNKGDGKVTVLREHR